MAAKVEQIQEEEEEQPVVQPTLDVEPPVTSTAIKVKRSPQGQAMPAVVPDFVETPIVELQRMPSNDYRTSNDRKRTVAKSTVKCKPEAPFPLAAAAPDSKAIAPISAIPLRLTPARSTRKG